MVGVGRICLVFSHLSEQSELGFCVCFFTGVPLVIVSLVLAIDKDAYGNAIAKEATVIESSDPL